MISTTYIAGIISFLSFGLPFLGIEVTDSDTLGNTIQQLVGVGAILYTFYGRYKAGGINSFGIRKR